MIYPELTPIQKKDLFEKIKQTRLSLEARHNPEEIKDLLDILYPQRLDDSRLAEAQLLKLAPKEWTEKAKHIREENPDMPEGMEWAISTEQYKKKHGHPPKRHRSEIVFQLLSLADQLDQKGFFKEADELARIINESGQEEPI